MDIFNYPIGGNTLGQYLLVSLIILIGFLCSKVFDLWIVPKLEKIAESTPSDLDEKLLQRCAYPVGQLIFISGFWVAQLRLTMAETVRLILIRILSAITVGLIFLILIRISDLCIDFIARLYLKNLENNKRLSKRGLRQQRTMASQVQRQATELTTMALGVVAILTIFSVLGLDLQAIWTSLGIGAVAIAVAIQDPLKNIFGRIYIFITAIFDEGHFIEFKEWSGTVINIGLLRTKLEVFSDMTTVHVPNAQFMNSVVKNYHGRTKFMYKWDLDVPYDTSPQELQRLIAELQKLVVAKPEVSTDQCWIYLDRLDRYSKVVRVWFQARLSGWSESLQYGNQVLTEIQELFYSLGFDFAFPTQTLQIDTHNFPPHLLPRPSLVLLLPCLNRPPREAISCLK
jgi:MscS family membrane protein